MLQRRAPGVSTEYHWVKFTYWKWWRIFFESLRSQDANFSHRPCDLLPAISNRGVVQWGSWSACASVTSSLLCFRWTASSDHEEVSEDAPDLRGLVQREVHRAARCPQCLTTNTINSEAPTAAPWALRRGALRRWTRSRRQSTRAPPPLPPPSATAGR